MEENAESTSLAPWVDASPFCGATELRLMGVDSLHGNALRRQEKYNWDQCVPKCCLKLVAYKSKDHTYRLKCD